MRRSLAEKPVIDAVTSRCSRYGRLVRSEAASPAAYLAEQPVDRRKALQAVRAVIRRNLPKGMVEAMNWGMITYQVPLRTFPATYNGQPLAYAALAAQKRYLAIYLMGIYADESLRATFEDAYRATGKRLDMGKSCVRFRTLQDLPLEVIGQAIGAMTLEQFLALQSKATGEHPRGPRPA